MAAWASEVADNLLSRRLLGERVLLYRLADGDVIACQDRCAHRFAPLSKGRKTATGIECAYHGLHFDRTGRCDHNPSGSGRIPPNARIRVYPLVERHQMLWIWMGDPARADASLIPDFSMAPATRGGVDNLGNYLHVKANCLLEIDNLMDLSHANFIHLGSLGHESMRSVESKVTTVGRSIRVDMWMPGTICAFGVMQGQRCDQWFDMIWSPPTSMILEFGAVAPGAPRVQDPHNVAFHIVTPETDRTTHYFFGSAGAFAADEEWKARLIGDAQRSAFLNEDNPMLEAVEENMDGEDLWELRPAILPNDKAAVMVRQRLQAMFREESAPESPDAQGPCGER